MGRYRIVFRKSVARDMRRIPDRDLRRILATIDSLSEDPRPAGTEKLSGQERYRVCQGDYRIIYEIHDEVLLVLVIRVDHRRNVYR